MKQFTLTLALALAPNTALAQGQLLDDSLPPGKNYNIASFRFWAPATTTPIRAVLVLVPGSNGDGRAMAQDTVWQNFATKHNLAIIACRFTDKAENPERAFENYIAVSHGSGDALQTALTHFADRSKRWEVANAPFLMWGMSAGGQFNFEYVAWKPERVVGFVVNKGGVYYSALLSRASRQVPGILFTGGKDLEFRNNTIVGLFNVNRRGGALWALAEVTRRRPRLLRGDSPPPPGGARGWPANARGEDRVLGGAQGEDFLAAGGHANADSPDGLAAHRTGRPRLGVDCHRTCGSSVGQG
jgi:poly(3-hydroxybutyrate) depolymerase